MSRVQVPKKDAQFANWAKKFAANAAVHAAELNLTPDQVEALTESVEQFRDAYDESQAAKAKAAGKVSTKDEMRRVCEDLIRPTARVINANPNIATDTKASLGINVTHTSVSPVECPTEVMASGYANGTNVIRWNRNGNAKNTTFLVEALYENKGPWSFVGITNKTKLVHSGQVPGRNVTYRVFAARDDKRSGSSGWGTIYEGDYSNESVQPIAA